MCQSAIAWAGISLVAYGTSMPTLQRLGFDAPDIRAEEIARRARFAPCQIVGGVLEAHCDKLFEAWDDTLPTWPPPRPCAPIVT